MKKIYSLIVTLFCLHIFDTIITTIILNTGGMEINPLINWLFIYTNLYIIILFKIFISTIFIWLSIKFFKLKKTKEYLICANILMILIMINNIRTFIILS